MEIPENVVLPKEVVTQLKDVFKLLALFSTLRMEFREQQPYNMCD